MIRLFLKFFILTVLILLVSKWTFEALLVRQIYRDRERVITGVHLGGMRLVAEQLQSVETDRRDAVLSKIQLQFRAPLTLRPLKELTETQRKKISGNKGFLYELQDNYREHLSISFDDQEYLRLGPFIDYTTIAFEDSLWGWLQLLAYRIDNSDKSEAFLEELSEEFKLPIHLYQQDELPQTALDRFAGGRDVSFYSDQGHYFASTKLEGDGGYICIGPLPEFKNVSESAARATLTSAFLASAFLIGLIILSLSRKFRRLENTAIAIAKGDLSARADERKAGETGELAKAMNLMADKTEAMIKSKRELLQAVSHELRTPLSRLKFAIDLLDLKSDGPKHDRRVQIVEQSMNDLESLVGEIIDYVKNDEYTTNDSREWIDVQTTIEPVSRAINQESPSFQVEYVIDSYSSAPMVYADRIAFIRTVKNLVGNAQRYARSKLVIRVHETVDAASVAKPREKSATNNSMDGSHLCIEFEDDGPGIPEDKWLEVVEPFVRLSEDSTSENPSIEVALPSSQPVRRNHTGIGLGLAIVNRYLKQHGGRLEITRGKSGGCLVRTFWPNPANQG